MEGRAEWLDLGRDVAVDKLSKKFCQAPNPDNAATDPTRMESTSKASQQACLLASTVRYGTYMSSGAVSTGKTKLVLPILCML